MASRGKGSKTKGSSFERKIAKLFGEKLFNNPNALKRTPLSGGGAWKGDIQLNPESELSPKEFIYCIECKNNEQWNLYSLFQPNTKPIVFTWWEQTIKACPKGKIPLLVMSKNFYPIFVMSNQIEEPKDSNYIVIKKNNQKFIILTLTDFFKEL